MRRASTRLAEQGTQTPSPAPDLIPAETKHQPRTYIGIGTANGGTSTASGGAWNASIVAEYFHFGGQTVSTLGLGSTISQATDSGSLDLLVAATVVMAATVVTINRLVWRRLYRLAEGKFRLEG
jgi:hypothetical protein